MILISPLLAVTIIVFAGILVCNLLAPWKLQPPGFKRLPGPRGIPILGSVLDLPKKHPWLTFYEWSKIYGPIYECILARVNHVCISSLKIAEELLSRRSTIYSDRPSIPAIMHDNRTSMHYVPLMGEDIGRPPPWQKFYEYLLSSTPRELLAITAQKQSRNLVLSLLKEPSNFKELLEHHVASITAQMAWDDDEMATAKKSVWDANNLIPRISLDRAIENKFSFLTTIPSWVSDVLQPWKADEMARFNREQTFWMGQHKRVKADTSKRGSQMSWTNVFFSSKNRGICDETEAAYAVGMLTMTGGVLLSSPIQTLFLALCQYPKWQTATQKEIYTVCNNRVPAANNIEKLPIVRALIREAFRWRSPVPLGTPCVLERDDIYDGYFIPKGTICLAAEWAITRDELLYPEPEVFNPERWLDPAFATYKEPLTHYPQIKGHSGFGWVDRACVGQDFSETVLITMVSTVLWSCYVCKIKDPNTRLDLEIPWMDIEPPNAIVRHTWFPLDILPRDEIRLRVLNRCKY